MGKNKSKLSKGITLAILTLGVIASVPMSALTYSLSELKEQDNHPTGISYEQCGEISETPEDICCYNHARKESEFGIVPFYDGLSFAFCGGGATIVPENLPSGWSGSGVNCVNGHGTTGIVWRWAPLGGNVAPPPFNAFRYVGWTPTEWGERSFVHISGGLRAYQQCITGWTRHTYRVTFDLNGGTRTGGGPINQDAVPHDTLITAPSVTRQWHNFTGWTRLTTPLAQNPLRITQDYSHNRQVTIRANWTRPSFRVDYDVTIDGFTFTRSGGGELGQNILNGNSASPPYMDQYSECGRRVWPGWADDGQTITGAKNITPNELEDEHIRRHEVIFDLYNDGLEGTHAGGGDLVQNIEHTKNAVLPYVNDPYGHIFIGWGSGDEHEDIQEATVITAIYEPGIFDIVFINYDGTVHNLQPVSFGSSGSFPKDSPIRKYGHSFAGWDIDSLQVTEEGDIIVHPIFKPLPFEVVFLNYDGTEFDSQVVLFNESGEIPEDVPVRYGHTFYDWDIADADVGLLITSESDIVISPIFDINAYRVVFKDYNDNIISEQWVTHGNHAVAPEAPFRGGFRFNGWDADFSYIASHIEVRPLYSQIRLDEDGGRRLPLGRLPLRRSPFGNFPDEGGIWGGGNHGNNGSVGTLDSRAVSTLGDGITSPFAVVPLAQPPIFYILGRPIYLFALPGIASWSVVNLVLTFLGLLYVAKILIIPSIRKVSQERHMQRKYNGSHESEGRKKIFGSKWLLNAALAATAAILIFIITQNLSALIALLDLWTIVHMALFIVLVVMLKAHKAERKERS